MKIRLYSFDPLRFHVVGKCTLSAWPVRNLEAAWAQFALEIQRLQITRGLRVFAFVMMSNHYHMLCSAESAESAEEVAAELHAQIRNKLNLSVEEFPEPCVTPIDHIEAYRNTYLYIYKNPVSAGLVREAEGYAFSTLPYMLGRVPEPLGFVCIDDMNLIVNPQAILDRLRMPAAWLEEGLAIKI